MKHAILNKKKGYKNTKILATLGPVTESKEKIIELIQAGIDGVRLNFSHGGHDYYETIFQNVNDACVTTSEPIAILIDLQGPKIRVGELAADEYTLKDNDTLEITMDDIAGTNERITCSYKGLAGDANEGDNIFIDDGLIKMVVIGKNEKSIFCKIIEGGILKPRKGINLPGMKLSLPSMTAKDFDDLDFALTHGLISLLFHLSARQAILPISGNTCIQKDLKKILLQKLKSRRL